MIEGSWFNRFAVNGRVPTMQGADGVSLVVKRTSRVIEARLDGATAGRQWKLQLAGVETVASVKNGRAAKDSLGVVISPVRGARTLRITLAR